MEKEEIAAPGKLGCALGKRLGYSRRAEWIPRIFPRGGASAKCHQRLHVYAGNHHSGWAGQDCHDLRPHPHKRRAEAVAAVYQHVAVYEAVGDGDRALVCDV